MSINGQSTTPPTRRKPLIQRHKRYIQPTLAVFVVCSAGCRSLETRFDITAFGEPGKPEGFTEPRFEQGSFNVNARKNHVMVFEVPPEWISVEGEQAEVELTANETSGAEDQDPLPDEVLMSQIIQVEVFWRPLPGTTYAESTQTNANILYCLIRGESAISYEGAGFVYFEPSRDGKVIAGKIESAVLFPTRFAGDPIDLFGPCHLNGSFTAKKNKYDVVAVQHRLRKRLGPPTTSDSNAVGP